MISLLILFGLGTLFVTVLAVGANQAIRRRNQREREERDR